jgi:multidrug efflux system outer membrane protein
MRTRVAYLLACCLAGCALAPAPERDDVRRQAMPHTVIPPLWTATVGPASAVTNEWLAAFGDDQLDALVKEALVFNFDLRAAVARVDQAAGYLQASGATLYPQVNLLARGGGKSGGDSSGLQGIGLFATWELDLWGRVRAGQAFARLQYESAELDAEYARQSIAALVAKGWFLAIEARLQQAQAQAMLKSADQLVALAGDRLRVGRGDEFDVTVARANVETLRDTERTLDLAYQQAVRSLETLVGRYPAGALAIADRLSPLPGGVPVGLPAELLERRPDVVAAERRVAGAFYRTEEAKAARLPRITLTGTATSISSELFVLKSVDNRLLSFGASLLQPIFLGGLLQAQVEVRTAEQQAAIAEYGRVSTRAFGEVENALSSSFSLGQREEILARAVGENARAVDLAGIRLRVGSGDLRAVQQQQLTLYSAQVALLRVRSERLVQRVNLHLALGGSFDAARIAKTTIPESLPVTSTNTVATER